MKVKEIAAQKGMSMTRLHHKSEVSYTTIRNVVRNPYTEVTLTTLARLSEALGVPTTSLIEDVDEDEGQ